ncbi:tRNA-i(6)A37 thiotransferase enzyme MiaB [Desulfuromusa kysingii]|uniref:tRNA-2-methylthio-N(6)-dimethylallyladenosine synthase n=1 Tax=Desulfuromusa kysingii TaxID=37625 RepID=A0A1H3YVG2_9BACT|nr:tRNA (N6-isopentenyl adenosine(37)-C2)-methylthiotransferase MiaB [Desulfuromusa kysingii]SEA15042.1 tRNA-i(6)A37 thiotransferase enzyme MiaB [Desulfuromusa kysingii]
MNKAFYLETFGCQMNVVDSEQIAASLTSLGYSQVGSAEMADVILLNTCSVRDKAERKVYGHLGRFKPIKDKRPDLIIGVGGCVAQQEGEKMLEKVAFLDLVFGTHNIHRLPELIQDVEQNRKRGCATTFQDRDTRLNLFPERTVQESVTRFVTVMQGCDNFCSYCIVPHVRGREISRSSADILTEVKGLVAQGVREITLLGQNVNSYNLKSDEDVTFPQLLEQIDAIEGLQRLRFATSHPKDLTDELINCFGSLDKLCQHIHLPFQSGSDRILKLMNRCYTVAEYLDKVERLKQVCPQIRLTTDIIVGFPGETEDDFQATLDLVKQVRYADAFTFLYSPRVETAAAKMPDGQSALQKQKRFERLLDLQQQISAEVWQEDSDQVLAVLVEGQSKQGEGQMFGRTTWNRIVNFQGPADLIGQTVTVKITGVFRNSHIGELVEAQ